MAIQLVTPSGSINGTNVIFSTPTPYEPGNLVVRLNGSVLPSNEVLQDVPATGQFSLTSAPQVGDTLIAAYLDPVTNAIGQPLLSSLAQPLAELTSMGGNDIRIIAGASDKLLTFTVIDVESGSRKDLTDYTLYFLAKEDSETGATVFDKQSGGVSPKVIPRDQTTEAGRGIVDVSFTSAETLAAAAKTCVFDFWAKTAGGQLIPLISGAYLEVRASMRSTWP